METETAKTTTTTTAVATATEPVSVPEVTKQIIVEEEEEVKSTITTTTNTNNNNNKKEGDDGDKEEEVKGDPPKERLEAIGKKYIGATDGSAVVQWDPYLEPYVDVLRGRYRWYKELLQRIDASEGGLENFAHSYKRYGLNRGVDPATGIPGTFYREWAPHGKKK